MLKTLKDLEGHTCSVDDCCRSDLITSLREEAIKWIKEFKKEEVSDENGHIKIGGLDYYMGYPEDGGADLDEICDWIKHFFNITDEDLK